MVRWTFAGLVFVIACGPSSRGSGAGDVDAAMAAVDAAPDAAPPPVDLPDAAPPKCGALDCYSVYAHGDHTLYVVDLQQKKLDTVGPFKAPLVKVGSKMVEDTITDLAVAPDNTIYVISE